MPTIIVQGRHIPVSDSFFKLSPKEQMAIVEQMAREAGNQPSVNTFAKADRELSTGEYAEDAAKSFGVGAAKGAVGLAGMAEMSVRVLRVPPTGWQRNLEHHRKMRSGLPTGSERVSQ